MAVSLLASPHDVGRPQRPAARASWTPAYVAGLVASAALGAFVFFWRLTTPSVVNDELIYRAAAAQYVRGVFELNLEHPPLAKLLIGVSHVLLGGTVFADRFAGALLGFLTGFLVAATAYVVARSARAAVAAGLLWWLLPVAPGIVHIHLARGTFLEGPMLFFLAASVLAATVAARDGRLRLWVLAGALAGLAAACKLTGVVAVAGLLPVAAVYRHDVRRVVTGTAAAAGAFAVAFLLPYIPMARQAPQALEYAFSFQLRHAADGHPQLVAGTIYQHQPWWSPFWFQAQYLGWAALVALLVAAAIGVARTRRPETWPAVAVLTAGMLLVASSPIKLPQYQAIWAPVLCVLAGAALAGGLRSDGRRLLPAAAAVLFVVLAGAGASQLRDVATESVQDYRAAGLFLRDRVEPGTPITVWGDSGALGVVLEDNPLPEPLPPDGRPAALVVDPTIADRRPNEDVQGWLEKHADAYEAHRFQRLTVYLRR